MHKYKYIDDFIIFIPKRVVETMVEYRENEEEEEDVYSVPHATLILGKKCMSNRVSSGI
jgi:hypothetical protein